MIERKPYVVRGLVCTPLIFLLLWSTYVGASRWLQFAIVLVTVLAIWFPYERTFDNQT